MPTTAAAIKKATAKDLILSRVISYSKSGWPAQLPEADKNLQPFFIRRYELTVVQDVLMWGIRVVIPSTLHLNVLQQLHDSHLGIVKMKSIARQFVWWPNIDEQIENTCKSCVHCQQNQPAPASAPLHPWQFPQRPWQRLHMDLAGPLDNNMFLIIMDAHSKWPEVFSMKNDTTSAAVISKMMEVISRFGIPEQIVTDNGRQFVSAEFGNFCKNNGIKHISVSVYHPRSNGEAERFVQTFKKGMKTPGLPPDLRLQKFLFSYRATPHSTTGVSPAELLQGRKLRTAFDLFRPSVQSNVEQAQARQEKSYNHGVRFRQFSQGQDVWVKTFGKNEETWTFGKVIKALGPVTYLVEVSGNQMRRHVDHLRAAPQRNQDFVVDENNTRAASAPATRQATPFHTPQPSPVRPPPTPVPIQAEPPELEPPVIQPEPPVYVEAASDASQPRYPRRATRPIDRLRY
ncbi:unnamed protein product [Orchesella dallaii]|uniref:RNA-directed DNA polymerase n=1 Tax=Orchesella dallaii TaxID=48710 RepID=A0ABP1PN35_9HEXA